MSKKLKSTLSAYAANLGKHAKRIVKRQESVGDAMSGVAHDTKKVGEAFAKTSRGSNWKEAERLTKKARQAYNGRNYEEAEDLFRLAIHADGKYALAHTYLGHALYKQGRVKEAIARWRRAIEVAPHSEAADKARRKIQHVEQAKDNYLDELRDSFR